MNPLIDREIELVETLSLTTTSWFVSLSEFTPIDIDFIKSSSDVEIARVSRSESRFNPSTSLLASASISVPFFSSLHSASPSSGRLCAIIKSIKPSTKMVKGMDLLPELSASLSECKSPLADDRSKSSSGSVSVLAFIDSISSSSTVDNETELVNTKDATPSESSLAERSDSTVSSSRQNDCSPFKFGFDMVCSASRFEVIKHGFTSIFDADPGIIPDLPTFCHFVPFKIHPKSKNPPIESVEVFVVAASDEVSVVAVTALHLLCKDWIELFGFFIEVSSVGSTFLLNPEVSSIALETKALERSKTCSSERTPILSAGLSSIFADEQALDTVTSSSS
mmetsp:Transcript_2610/g.3679  ORF Transcript_2610/g.3679 Transcript_2610/m.3679 type:complete len:337 (-) Transcript_2610:1045-2055(-)